MKRLLRSAPLQVTLAWTIWACALISVIVAASRLHLAAIPYGVYADAGRHWLSHEPLYELATIDGFQYFPQSALLFAPLAKLGPQLGLNVWRSFGWLLYASGVWRLAQRLGCRQAPIYFLLATVLCVVPAAASIGNGQANLMLGALMLHSCVELMLEHWWRAACVLVVGLALKPLAIVFWLLVWAAYAAMRWRLLLLIACVVLAPFLVRDAAYVASQYRACAVKLAMCAQPGRLFEDVRGLFATFGWIMPHPVYLLLRALMACAVLVVCLFARRQLEEPHATLLIAALASGYLMLFNPRTLSSSYAIPAWSAAVLAALFVMRGRKPEALATLGVLLGWAIDHHLIPRVQYWVRPLACIVFCVVVIREITRRARPLHRPVRSVWTDAAYKQDTMRV